MDISFEFNKATGCNLGPGEMSLLDDYNSTQTKVWRGLVGPDAAFKTEAATTPWVAKRSKRLLACLPGLGDDLNRLAAQLGLKR